MRIKKFAMFNSLVVIASIMIVGLFSCGSGTRGTPKAAAGNDVKDITQFTILGRDGDITEGAEAGTIDLNVANGTYLTALIPTITITGASVSPASGVAQDFTNPVEYTVTATDSSTKVYTVTVSVLPHSPDDKDITKFTISGIDGTIEVNTVVLSLPGGTTGLVPTIEINGESVSPASGVAQDFTDPVIYTVTAENSTTKEYTVTVNPSPAIITGSHITVSGASDVYLSYNPMTGDDISCCSYNATPECGAADVPDIACFVTLEFFADGHVVKTYDADPTPGVPMPGHGSASGPWSYTGDQLTYQTVDALMDTTEVYSVAGTYVDGSDTKMRLTDPEQIVPDPLTLFGGYTHNANVHILVLGGSIMDMTVNVETTVTVLPDYSWSGETVTDTACTGSQCPGGASSYPRHEVAPISGTITDPGTLIKIGSEYLIPIMNDPGDVFTLQP